MVVLAVWINQSVLVIHSANKEHIMTNTKENNIASKQVFTTGEAAKICNVSQQTIIRCFDSGRLNGFKVPGSRFRRIPKSELVRFMQQNGMDLNRLGSGCTQVLVIGLSAASVDSVIRSYSSGHNININHANDAWSAGFAAKECPPNLILINPRIDGINKNSILKSLLSTSSLEPLIVEVQNNSDNGLNVPPQAVDLKEVIKQAVQQLLSM
jgi:excisionase family DNA binding protein